MQAEAEVKEEAERRAQQKTDASLQKVSYLWGQRQDQELTASCHGQPHLLHLQERLEAAAKKARLQAEAEIAVAAEKDRAAHIASSMRKESSQAGELAAQVSSCQLAVLCGRLKLQDIMLKLGVAFLEALPVFCLYCHKQAAETT